MPAFMKLLEEWQNPFETETDLIRSLWLLIATPSSLLPWRRLWHLVAVQGSRAVIAGL